MVLLARLQNQTEANRISGKQANAFSFRSRRLWMISHQVPHHRALSGGHRAAPFLAMPKFPELGLCTKLVPMCKAHAFFKKRFYLYTFRERGREGDREGEEHHQCARAILIGCLLHVPNWGPGPQPRRVPWLGIQPTTFRFTGQHSVHWATPARARRILFDKLPHRGC